MSTPVLSQVHEGVLENGMRLTVVPRGPLPTVSLRLSVRAGTALDPVGKEGLASLATELLRRGTRHRKAEEIDEAVEFVGGHLGTGVSPDSLSVRITAPSEHLSDLLALLAELVREPKFKPAEVASAKARALAELATDRDDPSTMADRALSRLVWGKHPYGRDDGGTLASVRRLRRADLVAFHKNYLGPKVAALTIVGNVSLKEAARGASRAFRSWRGGPAGVPRLAAPKPAARPQALLLDGPELTQAQVRLAWQSFTRHDPRYLPAVLVNRALGGSFTSRLVLAARVKRGLTYGIWSQLDPLLFGGTFALGTSTKSGTTGEIIQVALNELERMRKGPSPAELAAAQQYITRQYPSMLEHNDAIAARVGEAWVQGLGLEWITRYADRVQAITHPQAVAAAKALLAPAPATLVVVGPARKVKKQLARWGPFKVQPLAAYE